MRAHMNLMHSDFRYVVRTIQYFSMAAAKARNLTRTQVEEIIQKEAKIKDRILFPGKNGSTKFIVAARGSVVLKIVALGRRFVDVLFEDVPLSPPVREGSQTFFLKTFRFLSFVFNDG